MTDSEDIILKVAQKVNLDKNDLKVIKRSNRLQRFQYWKFALFSFFIGFLGGWVFMSTRDDVSKIGYPLSQILIGFNFMPYIRSTEARKLFLLVISLTILTFIGFISGGTLGTFFHPTFNIIGSSTYYGVYSNKGA